MDPNDDNDSGMKKLKRKFGENPIVPLGLALKVVFLESLII